MPNVCRPVVLEPSSAIAAPGSASGSRSMPRFCGHCHVQGLDIFHVQLKRAHSGAQFHRSHHPRRHRSRHWGQISHADAVIACSPKNGVDAFAAGKANEVAVAGQVAHVQGFGGKCHCADIVNRASPFSTRFCMPSAYVFRLALLSSELRVMVSIPLVWKIKAIPHFCRY